MTAQPIHQEDPKDPELILRALPDREREEFLRQYEAAVDQARQVAGYKRLQQLLHAWSLRAAVVNQPGFYQRRDEAQHHAEHPELFAAGMEE
jgi:hypothetical protein